jgi:hypothetical protein
MPMAKAAKIRRDPRLEAARRLVARDIDFVAVLAAQFNRVLAVADPAAPALEADGGRAAERLVLALKAFWETSDPSLSAFKETEDATAYLVRFFTPMLQAGAFAQRLRTSDGFGAGLPPDTGGTDVSIDYVEHARRAFQGPLTRLEGAVAPWFAPVQLAPMRTAMTGVVLLTALPIWTVYHHFHGIAAYGDVQEHLRASLAAASTALGDVYSLVARPAVLDDRVVTLSPAAEQLLLTMLNALQAALSAKSGELDRFSMEVQGLPTRVHRTAKALTAERDAQPLWREGTGADTVVSLGTPPAGARDVALFPYLGLLEYEGGERTFARSFFALPTTWERLVDCARLVSQAGFVLVLTAACNPSGGRHPPHQTHRNGVELDLDWGFTSTLWQTGGQQRGKVRDLARRVRKPAVLVYIFRDTETGEYLTLVPNPADAGKPFTHTGIEALSTLVVIQALVLSGLRRYLYADIENMLLAADYLGLVLDPSLFVKVGRKANIPVAEGTGHYNHLHAEAQEGAARYLTPNNLTKIYGRALERDAHPEFQRFLEPPRDADDDTKQRVKAFTDAWLQRSKQDPPLPSLLPVWLPGSELSQLPR